MLTKKKAFALLFFGCIIFAGCSGQSSTAANRDKSSAESLIVGTWSTSTLPEMAASATTATFLDSGEYQVSSPLKIGGQTINVVVDGKQQPAPFTGSGTWEITRGQLQVTITAANIDGWKGEPGLYKIVEITDKKHVLEKDGETLVFFRVK